MRSLKSAFVTTVLAASTFAAIDIKISDETMIAASQNVGAAGCGNDTLNCCTNWGAAQYRYAGLKCVREGNTQSVSGKVNDINYPKGSVPFGNGIKEGNFIPPYVVYGVADTFKVPTTGVYTFWVKFDNFAYIIIDGQQLKGTDDDNKPMILVKSPWPVVGDSVSWEGKSFKTSLNLTAGVHNLKFYYSSSSDLSESHLILSWKKPGSTDFEIIPDIAFGTPVVMSSVVNGKSAKIFNSSLNGVIRAGSKISIANNSNIAKAVIYDLNGNTISTASQKSSIDLNKISASAVILRAFDKNGKIIGSMNIVNK